jgi:hypothetical protein
VLNPSRVSGTALLASARRIGGTCGLAYDENFEPTYTYENRGELVDVSGFETFRQVAWGNSWEGTSTVGLGVRGQLPFRVLLLPGRIVIDVAHTW